MTRPTAVVFDWDNTLVDTWPVIHQALERTFTAFDREPWSEAETKARVRRSLRDSFPELFGNRWEDARTLFYTEFSNVHLERLVAMEGAGDLLTLLADMGIPAAVVSNKTGKYLRAEVAHLDWDGHFISLVGAGDALRDKPEVDPLIMALAPRGIKPHADVWFVGDAGVDMQIALAAGCTPVLLHPDAEQAIARDEFVKHPPAFHRPGCAALHDLIETL